MKKGRIAVLGISAGTRRLGISIFYNNELIDWRISEFKGTWSQVKLARILRTIERLATRHNASAIALKIPSLGHSSPGLKTLITAIKELCEKKKIAVDVYRIIDLKRHCFPFERSKKKALPECIAEKYPEVYLASKKEKGNRNPYYIPMFEAIIAALVYLKKHHEI